MFRPSLTRNVLPVVALIGILIAVWFIASGRPDRAVVPPQETPARANGELAGKARVAGSGIVEPSSEVVEIGTSLSGLVEAVLVEPGQRVTKGQPLFRVDGRATRARIAETQAAIGRARAAIAEANAAEATANQQLALYKSIDDPLAVSRSEVIRVEGQATSARARRQLAQAELAAAQAQLGSARTELDRLTVRAPIAGEILRIDVRPGELVNAGPGGGGPYIRMGETNPLYVRIDIDENEAGRVKVGAEAIISPRGDADTRVKAGFVRVEPLVVPKRSLTNEATERVDVRVLQIIYELPQGSRFRVGQQVDAFILAEDGAASE